MLRVCIVGNQAIGELDYVVGIGLVLIRFKGCDCHGSRISWALSGAAFGCPQSWLSRKTLICGIGDARAFLFSS